jgi:hypothetical protein
MQPIECPKCGLEVAYNVAHCHSGHFVGFPNVRLAEGMRERLNFHYGRAAANARERGVGDKIDKLESILANSIATINVTPIVLRNLSLGDNYKNYYVAIDEGIRELASRQYHSDRQMVDTRIHTAYEKHILNAALSIDGLGLTNYGNITLRLRENVVDVRASLLRENGYAFFERYDLGRLGRAEELGWRSVWSDRTLLAVAHLEPSITPATPLAELTNLILCCGEDRRQDRYIEVHIFGELDWQAIGSAMRERPLTNPEDQADWELARTKLTLRGIECID